MAKSIFSRPFDLLMVFYFLTHIPITVFVDSQAIIPREWYPQWARDAVDWHVNQNGDHLVGTNPLWFKSFVFGEVFLQLPVFLPLAYGLIKDAAWVRIPSIIYGSHVVTTVIPMLAEFYWHKAMPNWVAFGCYLPYMLLPLALVLRMCFYPIGNSQRKTKIA